MQPVILYVEDDEPSADIMRLLLCEQLGIKNVTFFDQTADFLTRAHQIAPVPTLFFLDIHIAPHDGFALLRMLRADAQFHQSPVIALTASVMNEEVALLREAGFDGVIAKPIDIDIFPTLLERIQKGDTIW